MALVLTKVDGDFSGPVKTGMGRLWWARAKLAWSGGSVYVNGGMPLFPEFTNVFGLKRIIFLGCDHVASDVTFTVAEGVCSAAMGIWDRTVQRLFMYGVGRAVNGAGGVLVNPFSAGLNGTSIDGMTFLVQVWGLM